MAFTYISRNSTGNMTPFEVFCFWKFPWKYDLLWRQKLQETGISNRFPAVSTASDAFHPTSRAEKSPRTLIFSFCASSFGGKSLNTKIASTECFLGRVWANFALAHQHVGEGKREFPEFPHRTERKCAVPLEILVESQGYPSGNRVVEIDPSRAGNVRKGQLAV